MHNKVLLFIAASVMMFTSCSKRPELIAPGYDSELTTNTPVLSWTGVPCDRYDLLINGVKVAQYDSKINSCVPFPLAYGVNEWQIVAVKGKRAKASAKSSFTVTGKTLNRIPDGSKLLREGWLVKSTCEENRGGEAISTESIAAKGWAHTSVPSTVLTALVREGVYPNPYVEMNNMLIPDSDDEYNKQYNLLKYSHIPGLNPWAAPYWFVTEFDYGSRPNGDVILCFEELNYRGEVWLNGVQLSSSDEMVGMERSYNYVVTDRLVYNGTNHLAVKIFPVDVPGTPAPDPIEVLSDPGCNMGDGRISVTYSKWDTMGWDWQPPVRDRDMGLTEEVYLYERSTMSMDNLYVSSDLELPSLSKAHITISADLVNNTEDYLSGTLSFIISGKEKVEFSQNYMLAPNERRPMIWSDKDFKELLIEDPQLWWPAGYGEPYLYGVEIKAVNEGKTICQLNENFGIRKINTYIGNDERIIEINGRKIYPRGGNWVIDMMLNWTAERYEREILLTKNAGLNMLRVWGPTGIAPEAFFDAADKYGVMIWQDFLNDYWGTLNNRPGYRPDEELFCNISTEIVKKYRNHPSLVMWCGGNEGVNPREQHLTEEILPEYDGRDSRFYLKASDNDGLHGGGPYYTMTPQEYFTHPKLHGFSSEIGPSGIPVAESVGKTLNGKTSATAEGKAPLDGLWAFHDANDWPGEDTRKFSSYDNMLRSWYGEPVNGDLPDYIDKAQIVNYDVYRASLESINRLLWDRGSGILLWKANSSWPSLTWQVYDWFLQAHAGYYATKNACSPVHAQWNRDDNSISVLNLTKEDLEDIVLNVDYYYVNGKQAAAESEIVSVAKDEVIRTSLAIKVSAEPCFVRLSLVDKNGELLSNNTYWICEGNDFTSLATLPVPTLKVSARKNAGDKEETISLIITNDSDAIAFMTEFRLSGKKSGCEVLPSFWSDNFFILLPKEEKRIEVCVLTEDITEDYGIQYRMYGNNRTWTNVNID